jgi:tRNA threonylcarbamoyladenosine biosynthesis protein TsaE
VQFYETAAFPGQPLRPLSPVGPDEAYEIGLDEALETGAVIEWPQRLEGIASPPTGSI